MTAEPPPCTGADNVSARSARSRRAAAAATPGPARPHLHVVLEAAPVGGGAAPAAAVRRPRRGHVARPDPVRAALAAAARQQRSTRM